MKNNQGFSLVAGLLIVLIVAVVCFAGYYVWNENQPEKADNNTYGSQTEENNNTSNTDVSRSEDWVTFESGQSGFNIKVPDGWKMTSIKNDDWAFVGSSSDAVYRDGQPAIINKIDDYGGDGPITLTIIQFKKSDDYIALAAGDKLIDTIKLGDISAKKYYREVPVEQSEAIGDLPGQQSYTYVIDSGEKETIIYYNRQTLNEYTSSFLDNDEENLVPIVEEMLNTIVVI